MDTDLTLISAVPRTVSEALDSVSSSAWVEQSRRRRAIATGFPILDEVLAGGIRAGDLVLIGGQPGVGKTILALQWARHMAFEGHDVVYACYEHDEVELLGRLLLHELQQVPDVSSGAAVEKSRLAVLEALAGERTLDDQQTADPLLHLARRRLREFGDRLSLVRASGSRTDLGELARIVHEASGEATVLFVDYLQKIALRPEPEAEAEKVRRVTEGLKELALSKDLAVVAIAAANRQGLERPRLRLHHLRGSSALAYESDVAILLNDKFRSVAKAHLTYDPVRAETFKHQVVFSLEKNRGGRSLVDLEFRKDFANYRFDPSSGGFVAERLIDERIEDE